MRNILQPGLKALERSLLIASLDAQFHHPLVVLFPCIERCRRHPQRTLGARAASSGYRKTFPNIETGRPDATGLLNKADGKNRESENPERYLCSAGAPPTVALEHLRERFETENRQRGEEVAQVFVNTAETTRPRRVAPRGLALTDDRRSWRMGIWLPI